MPAITFDGYGAAYEPAPVYTHDLRRYSRDSRRALRAYRRRKHPRLAGLTLWTPLVAFAVTLSAHATFV
jgi:hypothetical protein